MSIDVDLSEHPLPISDQNNDLASSVDAAGEIVFQLRHIIDDLVLIFGNGSSANPSANRNQRVVGLFAYVFVQHQTVTFQSVNTAPIVARQLIQQLHRLPAKLTARGRALTEPFRNSGSIGGVNHGYNEFYMPYGPIILTPDPLDPESLRKSVESPDCGGVVLFCGEVRSVTGDEVTVQLDYEAYEEMAIAVMTRIADETEAKFGAYVAVAHRTGVLKPGEIAVVTVAACPHRAEAFQACKYLIDRIKEDVPIWKREER